MLKAFKSSSSSKSSLSSSTTMTSTTSMTTTTISSDSAVPRSHTSSSSRSSKPRTSSSSSMNKPSISVSTSLERNKSVHSTKSITSVRSNGSLNSVKSSSSISSGSSLPNKSSVHQNIKNSTMLSPITQSTFIPNYNSYKFLIVDDNLINLKILYKILSKLFPNSLIVKLSNSSTILKLIEQETFDLVFLDIEMPPISGVEIAKRIRSIKKHNKLGLIAVTTKSGEKDMKVYKKVGIDFTFKKPMNNNLNLILNNIEIILNFRKSK